MGTGKILLRITDVIFTVAGVVVALIRLLGYAFFASNLSFAIVIPAFVVLAVVILPIRLLSSQRWLLLIFLIIYLASYVFGGYERIQTYGHVMPDLLEVTIVVYFFVRAMFLKAG